jgi:diguanylate cyclase
MRDDRSIAKRIARWVGSGSENAPPERTGSFARASDQRRDLYERIGDFLFEHDLELTPLNFSLANDFLTGNNHRIATAVAARIRLEAPITDSWAEALVAQEQNPDLTADALSAMVERIEANLGEVSSVIGRSQSSAQDYSAALAGAAQETPADDPASGFVKLLGLTEAMIRETRDVEQELRRQQKQVALLEKNLASARHAAEHDHLTGLPNRRAFEACLAEEAKAAREANEPLTVAFCDIDHFKQVNDGHGHETGDRVLKLVAEVLSEISDDRCHVARHGGEEFVMLFRNRGSAEVFDIVDGTRSTLFQRTLVNKVTKRPLPNVTFSAGIADVLVHEDPRVALKAADQALYLAKTYGRNQVRIAI